MAEPSNNPMIAQWLKEKGYTEEESQKILRKLAEHEHETLSDAVFDSIGNSGPLLDKMFAELLRD